MDHAVVQKWLRDVVQPYNESDRVFIDVDKVLVAVSSLSPKTEVYTYDDGRTQLLLIMSGTIPIQFRNATYNIPVDIWVPRTYPREPPIVYVRPTSTMLVRKGRNVDVSGKVGGDYLQHWEKKWESCNLLDLVHSCQQIFGQEPPVYAKPKQPAAPASPVASSSRASLDLRERQPPAPPNGSQHQSQSPTSPIPPMRPAKQGSPYQGIAPATPSSFGWQNGHAFPPRGPEGRHTSWHVAEESDRHLNQAKRSSSIQSGYAAQDRSLPQAVSRPPTVPSPMSPTIPPLPPNPHQHRPAFVSPPPSISVPTPPRPPNPELLQMHNALHLKIQSRLHHLRSTTEESQHQLRLLISDLDRGEPAIQDEMARLEAVRDVCKATGDGLEGSVMEAQKRIHDLKNCSEPDVDNMICATSIVGNQLLDLVASDSAIEDTLFYLGQALHSEVLEVERYLKQTRFLAREQFMRRALAQKITEGMGW